MVYLIYNTSESQILNFPTISLETYVKLYKSNNWIKTKREFSNIFKLVFSLTLFLTRVTPMKLNKII